MYYGVTKKLLWSDKDNCVYLIHVPGNYMIFVDSYVPKVQVIVLESVVMV